MEMKKWENADNYMGGDYTEYYVIYARTRDSDNLVNSNYAAFVDILKEYPIEENTFRHWACGWVEAIMIHEENITDEFKLRINDIYHYLEQYPVLDDEDYSRREYDEALEAIENASNGLTKTDIPDSWREEVFTALWDMGSYIEEGYVKQKDLIKVLKELDFYDIETWEE